MRRILRSFGAEDAIREALAWSIENFGEDAAARYTALILRAEEDLAAHPERIGVIRLAGGVLAYHLRYSARRMPPHVRVKAPVHTLLARSLPDGSLLILGLFGLGAIAERQARRALREQRRRPGYAAARTIDEEG